MEKKLTDNQLENKNIPTGKYWKEVLIEIDRFAPNNYGESSAFYINDDKHPLARKLKISGNDLGSAISYLISMKLIDKYVVDKNLSNDNEMIFITPQGSLFVRNLEQQQLNKEMLELVKEQTKSGKRQEKINQSMKNMTIFILLLTLISTASVLKTIFVDVDLLWIILGLVLFFLICFVIVLFLKNKEVDKMLDLSKIMDAPKELTAPFKITAIAFILFICFKIIVLPLWSFFVLFGIIAILDVFHNDYLRPKLNQLALKK